MIINRKFSVLRLMTAREAEFGAKPHNKPRYFQHDHGLLQELGLIKQDHFKFVKGILPLK